MSGKKKRKGNLPYDGSTDLYYIFLIWGLTLAGPELYAVASDKDAKERYIETAERSGKFKAVHAEESYVDHIYGGAMLRMYKARMKDFRRRALNPNGEGK